MGSTTFWKLNLWCAFITSPCFSSGFFLLLLPPTYILRRWLKIHTLQKSSFLVEFFKLLLLGFASCRVFCSQNVRHEIHFLKYKIFTVEMKGTFRVIYFQILCIFLPFLTSPEKFSSTLKWPWLETKTEKSKQHFYVAKKKSFWLPQLVKGNNIRSKALWPFYFLLPMWYKTSFSKGSCIYFVFDILGRQKTCSVVWILSKFYKVRI